MCNWCNAWLAPLGAVPLSLAAAHGPSALYSKKQFANRIGPSHVAGGVFMTTTMPLMAGPAPQPDGAQEDALSPCE